MSEALKIPNALQDIEVAYNKTQKDFNRLFEYTGSDTNTIQAFKTVYETSLNNYRDLCTVIVERLMRENPKVLEDMHVLYLS